MIVLLASCASLKTAFTGNQGTASTNNSTSVKKETKFLDQIDVPVESSKGVKEKEQERSGAKKETPTTRSSTHRESDAENLSSLQIKYAVLLNTPAEEINNPKMFEFIDDWYGTPYRLGGNTKNGIDCSAFSQFLFASVYGLSIPRTAREQYNLTSRIISRTQLTEGDLIFFNTRGGISHVGVYLQNNKFVHASTSGGVMISDIYDEYWAKKFVGVGRLKDREAVVSAK